MAEKARSLVDFMREKASQAVDAAPAAIRGVGQGATAGFLRYPAAALMVGIDQATGNGAMRYSDALQAIRDQDENDRQEYGAARFAGELGGGILGSIGTAGASIPATIARSGILGAASGFTEKAGMEGSLEDTLKGAGIGAAFGLLGGAAEKAKNTIIRNQANRLEKKFEREIVNSYEKNLKELARLETLGKRTKDPAHRAVIEEQKAGVKAALDSQQGQIEAMSEAITRRAQVIEKTGQEPPLPTDAEKLKGLLNDRGKYNPVTYDIDKSPLTLMSHQALQDMKENLMSRGLRQAGFGAAGFGGIGALMGYDPITSAALGAGISPVALAGGKAALLLEASRRGVGTGETLARLGTRATVPYVVNPNTGKIEKVGQAPDELDAEFEKYRTKEPVMDLDAEFEKYRQK